MKKQRIKAFTLVELLIVVTIIAILVTIWTMSFFSYMKDANDSKRTTDIQTIKIHLDNYRRNHSFLYPTVWFTGSTKIMNWSTEMANQWPFDEFMAWKVDLVKVPLDPLAKKPYLYSVSADRLTYQVTATLESKENIISFEPSFNKAYAADDYQLIAYVEGNFIPTNKNLLPWLLYSTWNVSTFNINTAANIAKVIVNWQSQNMAYDMNWSIVAKWTSLNNVLASVSLVENSSLSTSWKSCTWILNPSTTFYNWENDISYMSWTSINSQIWWKYKTCDWSTWNMKPTSDYYYNCTNIWDWAKFDLTCKWLWCDTWYTARTDWVPWCKLSTPAPVLSNPINWGYNIPINWLLSWNTVKWTNISYKVYLAASPAWLTTVLSTQSWTTYSFSNLAYSTTYTWKVEACENSICTPSNIYTFSTVMSAWWAWTPVAATDPAVRNCEAWNIVCTADDVVISYIWTSWTPLDWTKDNFWLSARNWNNFYWNEKVLQYKIQNNSDWRAKFKVKLAKTWSTLAYIRHANSSFDDSDSATVIDIWSEAIAKNLFWTYWNWCIYNSTSWQYEIIWKSSCFITINARSDSFFDTTSSIIWNFAIINMDPLSTWSSTAYTTSTPLYMSASWYNAAPLVMNWLSHSQQELEPSLDISSWNFWSSTRIWSNSYWYWKWLTYRIVNSNTSDSYFKMWFSWTWTDFIWALWIPDDYYFSTILKANSTLAEDDINNFTWSKSIDLQSNWIWNVFWRNDTCTTSPSWIWIWQWFKVSANNSCDVTIYYRADIDQPYRNKNIFSIILLNQPIYNKDYGIPDKILKANTAWWMTDCTFAWVSLFNWFCYFSN